MVMHQVNRGLGEAERDGFEYVAEYADDQDIRKVSSGIYGQILRRKIRDTFYGMKPRDFSRLSRKYGINYIVMNKKYQKKKYRNLKIAYENKHYIVYQL